MSSRWVHASFYGLRFWVLLIYWILPTACSWRAPIPPESANPSPEPEEGTVTLSNVVLAQTNNQGSLLWKLQARGVTYGQTQQVVNANALQGQLYQAGQPIFDLTAQRGQVQQTDKTIRLQGNIKVVDRKRKLVFKGREANWNPQDGVLQVKKDLTVAHPEVQVWANTLTASNRGQTVQVFGNVVMETRRGQGGADQSRLRLKTDRATWQVDRQSMRAGTPAADAQQASVQIERLGAGGAQDSALAGEVEADFTQGVLVLRRPAHLTVGRSPVTLTAPELSWDTKRQRLTAPGLLRVEDRRQQVTIIANQGMYDQGQNLIDLQGNVEVVGLRDRARLTTDQLFWRPESQLIEALGNVNFVNPSPAFQLRGPRAVGKIAEQTIRVSGGNVVTEIVP